MVAGGPQPEGRIEDRLDTRECHLLIVIGRSSVHVDVGVDNAHGTVPSWAAPRVACPPVTDASPERESVSKAPLSRITIRKYLYDGSPSYVWEGSVVESDAEPVVVEAYFQHARRDLGYVVFERGDVF